MVETRISDPDSKLARSEITKVPFMPSLVVIWDDREKGSPVGLEERT